MTIKLAVVMDPIHSIKVYKDSSFAMLLEAQRRGYDLYYIEQNDLYLQGRQARSRVRGLKVMDDKQHWHEFTSDADIALADLDVILMRKDPPFNMDYIYSTYVLEHAEQDGVLVVNRPSSLRNANEKLFALQFPQCIPPTCVSSRAEILREFIAQQQDAILKPLDGMGGESIFRVTDNDPNLNVIIETMTHHSRRLIMAQQYLPEIRDGDKRILLIQGEPVPYALARLPGQGETRANLAAGGRGEGIELSERDHWICKQVGPVLRQMGLMFVGLDVIGNYLTEINVTSPTCIRELDKIYNLNISGLLMEAIEQQLQK